MNISYDYYRVFYYVAKYKSFTKAANILINNQPNITRMMKKLEEEIGCKLFIRQRRGVILTYEGEKLFKHIEIAFDHILSGEQEIIKDRSLDSGIVTIAVSEIAMHCLLLPILKVFRHDYPNVRIRILNHSTPQAIEALNKGMIDFAIVTDPFQPSTTIESIVVRDIQEVLVCNQSYSKNKISINELKQLPMIGLGNQTSSYTFYSNFFNQLGIDYELEIEAATADLILPMIKSDLGIGFVPEDFLTNENKELFKVLELDVKIPSRNICILKRKANNLSVVASKLEELILM